jgi:hypothetical protein
MLNDEGRAAPHRQRIDQAHRVVGRADPARDHRDGDRDRGTARVGR